MCLCVYVCECAGIIRSLSHSEVCCVRVFAFMDSALSLIELCISVCVCVCISWCGMCVSYCKVSVFVCAGTG